MTQQSNKQKDWIDEFTINQTRILSFLRERTNLYDKNKESDFEIIIKEVIRDFIEDNQPDYESKIKELIERRTNIKERNTHPINPVYFLEDLQELLYTTNKEGQ